jgi:hypothetical protein
MAQRSFARAIAPGLVLVFLSAGCGSALPNVPLPAKPAAEASAPGQAGAGPVKHTVRGQVLAGYLGYWQAYAAALRTRDLAAARKLLARYADGPFVTTVTAPLPRVWASHVTGYGYAVPHVLSVSHTATSALVHDCLDLSHLGTQDVRTGRVVPGSFGLAAVDFYVTLARSGKRWLISKMQQVEVPCSP